MIQVTPQMRIFVAVEPEDFRKGIDGLAKVCRDVLKRDPFSGSVFVFRNRSSKSVKLLVYDGQGHWLMQKRLSQGRFTWWPDSQSAVAKRLQAHELQLLLFSGNPEAAKAAPAWRPVCTAD